MKNVNEILAAIGAPGRNEDGSYTRTCLTPEYFESVRIAKELMDGLGMQTEVNRIGTLHGVLPGSVPGLKSILVGSHLDTVISGGLFDGAFGVACGIEAVRRLKESGKTLRHPLEIYGFDCEESNPMGGTFGARCVAGNYDPQQLGLKESLEAFGLSLDDADSCRRDFSDVKCYLEAHIEQGDLLDNEHITIGTVQGIVSIVRYVIDAIGQSNHAGTTMMKNRHDAMVGMARLISEADRRCREIDPTLVLTFGTIECFPGAENVIPGRVRCGVETRHMDIAVTDRMIDVIREIAAGIDTVDFDIRKKERKPGVTCDRHIMDLINASAEDAGISFREMASGAGHDAVPIAKTGTPTAMIFVPSRGGLSHCGEEWTDPEDIAAGAEVVYRTILKLDEED